MGRETEELELAGQIGKAIENKEFILYFQPQYHLITKEISGIEALVRWMHPQQGMIMPSRFIPLAEKTGQIFELEKLIFLTALKRMEEWEKLCYVLELSINFSSRTLTDSRCFKEIEHLISCSSVEHSRIILEMTETASLHNLDLAAERMHRLKNMGIQIALDDFGTGYSSLAYLRKLPIDIIKIDKSFIKLLPENQKDAVIVKHIIILAHQLGCKVVAEGIEKQSQLDFLNAHSCETGQGYLLCRPVPLKEVYKLI